MPRIKVSIFEFERRKIISIIEKNKILCGYTDKDVIRLMSIPEATYYKRKKFPGTFTQDELSRLCKTLRIPKEERGELI